MVCAELYGVTLSPGDARILDGMEKVRMEWLQTPADQRVMATPMTAGEFLRNTFGSRITKK